MRLNVSITKMRGVVVGVVRMGGELGVGDPVLPCRRKTLKRFETGAGEGDPPEDVCDRPPLLQQLQH